MPRRDGNPIWIREAPSQALALIRADLRAGARAENYDEAWLQRLLHLSPGVLPVEQIEPGFGPLVPLCRELPLTFGAGRSGALDNLPTTPDGGLFLVEAKLWRNPDARRTVVAQAMEYAAAVFRLTYEELESAVLQARASEAAPPQSIFEIVSQAAPGVDETEFIDAVSRNLSRGRAIISVVGDGIREDLAPLAELLQTHAGHRFTFALVELAIYETPRNGTRIIIPSVLAQTKLIERGVVQIEDDATGLRRIVVREPTTTPATSTRDRSFGIGEDEFYEILGERDPQAPALLKSFLAKAEARGITADRKGGLNLKHTAPNGKALNLGTIDRGGFVETSPATWWDRTEIGRRYNDALAAAIGGYIREMKEGRQSAVRTVDGKTPRISDFLPAHEDAWLAAIDRYVQDAFGSAEI